MASGRTLSARRLHRHQHVETRRECRRLLQQARDVRAMDQGGKRRNQVDTAVMSVIRRQRGSSTASCAGLQSRQFSAHAGDAGADQGVVADEPEGKADQERRQDRQPCPLCRVSDGRSRHSEKSLCRHSADDRGTAAAARCIDSIMRSVSRIPSKTGGKVRLDDGKFGKFSVRLDFGTSLHSSQTCPRRSGLANNHEQTQSCLQSAFIWRMPVQLNATGTSNTGVPFERYPWTSFVLPGQWKRPIQPGEGGGVPPKPPISGALRSYLIGIFDRRDAGRTRLHILNPTARNLRVWVAFFDDNEKPLTCVRQKLSGNGLLEIYAFEHIRQPILGVVKVVALHEKESVPQLGIVGNQRQIFTTQGFFFKKQKMTETGLHPVPEEILLEDLKNIR